MVEKLMAKFSELKDIIVTTLDNNKASNIITIDLEGNPQ